MKGTVLIVDDARVLRMSMGRALQSVGYAVQEADDGTQALEMLEEHVIDLIIADINMKYMSGLEMLQRVRANPKTADVPVVMCTISNQKKDVLRAANLGIKGFLLKPVKLQAVVTKVNEILGDASQESGEGNRETEDA